MPESEEESDREKEAKPHSQFGLESRVLINIAHVVSGLNDAVLYIAVRVEFSKRQSDK